MATKRNRADIITFTEEQAAELAKTSPGEEASVSEKVSPPLPRGAPETSPLHTAIAVMHGESHVT